MLLKQLVKQALLLFNTQNKGQYCNAKTVSSLCSNAQEKEEDNPISGRVIVIDPGHGGSDEGVVTDSGYCEKTFTLLMADKLDKALKQQGAVVVLTHYDDRNVRLSATCASEELQARVNVANRHFADAFISIHANGFYDNSVGGAATYYHNNNELSSALAQFVHQEMVSACGLIDRGFIESELYILKHCHSPAILIEPAFLSNNSEERRLLNPLFQDRLTNGIVKGLSKYFNRGKEC